MSQQYAYRSQKTLGLLGGTPDYESLKGFESPPATCRLFSYSSDGRLFAYIVPEGVRIHYSENAELLREILLPNILDVKFSPRATYIMTWERLVKQDEGAQHKNLRVFSVSTGEELTSFTQKALNNWALQFTISESHAIRLVNQEVQVFQPANWEGGIVDKVTVEGVTTVSLSPGLNPSLAVFIKEKNGKPANIRIYSLLSLASSPTCQKATFRAENATFKWNTIGTQVLGLVRTDVDASGKSYYGETRLYILSAAGNFDRMVDNPKEGPIHDFAWNPNSKEFAIVSGFTPSKTLILDSRTNVVHDFGTSPNNFISFNPQGRLIALAGFGNMSNPINIYDRKTLEKVASIDAPNTTECEWSPDGRFLLTATLSPRLRVDNGIKIWHCTGQLQHVQLQDELYQVSWRPTPVDAVAPFPPTLPPAPTPNASVGLFTANVKQVPVKAVGAYRPPGARGTETPSYFKRRDGLDDEPASGSSTPTRYGRSPAPGAPNGSPGGNGYGLHPNGHGNNRNGGKRHVPGSAPSPSPARGGADGEKKGGRNAKKKDGRKKESGSGAATPVGDGGVGKIDLSSLQVPPVAGEESVPPTPGVDGSALDATSKKIRKLTKKLKEIEELKGKVDQGERLEATQLNKIKSEAEVRGELAQLTTCT